MARDVTVTLSDGTTHIYKNVPDNITADQVEQRAAKKYPGQRVVKISGAKPSRTAVTAAGVKSGFGNVAIGAGNLVNRMAAAAADVFGVSPAESAAWAAKTFAGKSEKDAAAILRNLENAGVNSWSDLVNASRKSLKESRVAATQTERQARPNYFTGGEILGETIASTPIVSGFGSLISRLGSALSKTAPVITRTAPRVAPTSRAAPVIARVAPRVATATKKVGRAVQQTGAAVKSGGTGVRATATAARRGAPVALTRKGRIALRTTGGAVAGTTGALLSDQDIEDAAAGGAIVPLLGTVARRGMGWTYDFVRRRLGDVKAAEIMRNLIADKSEAIIEALNNAPQQIKANTAEFLAKQGLLTPELAAATRIAGASKASKPLEDVALARAAEQERARTFIRGGETQTGAVQNIAAAKQNVRDVTAPMRERELGASDVGRLQIVPAERQADQLNAIADEINATEFVKRMRGLEGRTGEQAELMATRPDVFPEDQLLQRTQYISGEAGRRADQSIDTQIALRDQARAAQAVADNLRRQGLKPLDISTVVGRLRAEASNAEFVNPPRHRILSEFANNLERRAAKFGGIIDATGLYELRKNMGNVVSDLLGTTDPKALQSYTAQIIADTQKPIDDAIEAAGGKGWRKYLDTFAQGMRNVERQQFERELTKLPEARFVKVMEGDDPDFVKEFFGPGRFDIEAELKTPQFGPSKLGVAQNLASDIAAQRAVTQTGLEGLPPSLKMSLPGGARARVADALEPGKANWFARVVSRLGAGAPGIYGGGFAGDQLAQEYSNLLAENVMRRLAPALASPSEAARLAGVRSSSSLLGDVSLNVSPLMRNALAQYAQRYMVGDPVIAPPAEADYTVR